MGKSDATSEYIHEGGTHWISNSLKNLSRWAHVKFPHTKESPSEALCFGLSGGIGIGYSFCPSIPNYFKKHGMKSLPMPVPSPKQTWEEWHDRVYQCGSGVSIPSYYRSFSTNGEVQKRFFERLNLQYHCNETAGKKSALDQLVTPLESGIPVLCWTCPLPHGHISFGGTCGMYCVVAFEVDHQSKSVTLGDFQNQNISVPLDDFQWARNRVCSLKNRTLTIEPVSKPLTLKQCKSAIGEAIADCVKDFLEPKLKTFSLPGLQEWSKLIANERNSKKGWPKFYAGSLLNLALKDMFCSIELEGTGGGLMRFLFADFLEEAAELSKKKKWNTIAKSYRNLGREWNDFADSLLPSSVPSYAKLKTLLREIHPLLKRGDAASKTKAAKKQKTLHALQNQLLIESPLDEDSQLQHLRELAPRIEELHDAELNCITQLATT